MMKIYILFLIASLGSITLFGQTNPEFTILKQVKTTPVKKQARTGTCWSFATTSFIETEALRMSKKEYDLSEMFFVYHAYLQKAQDYVMFHGKANFSEGGQAHDVLNVVREFGLVTESVYDGIEYDLDFHNHAEMAENLTSIVKNAAKKEKVLLPPWYLAFKSVLESYLGVPPVNFKVGEKEYNSKSFNDAEIKFNPDDYVEFTSYTHHPFYEKFDLEVPDNWSHDRYMNIPIDDLMKIIDNALNKGFSIDWDGDVSEDNFEKGYKTGKAILREKDIKKIQDIGFQRYRQQTFENYTTTDDHLMHIVGTAKDKDGKLFYLTKNSWGNYNDFGGYLYISKEYVKLKSVAILVHKDAIPKNIARRCGL